MRHPHLCPLPSEPVSQYAQPYRCHAEQSEASRIFRLLRSRDSSAAPQNDIATQPLKGEELSEITAGDKSIGLRLSSAASPCASLCDA